MTIPIPLTRPLRLRHKLNPGDRIQLVPEEMSVENMMRIWDAITPPYRLSFPYTARIVEIETDPVPDGLPAVATRF